MQSLILKDVTELTEGYDVEIVRHDGRLALRAKNEGGNNETIVDLLELAEWLQRGPKSGRTEGGFYLPTSQ
jgi:hypothetical protein